MSQRTDHRAETSRRHGLSRRDFVLGRFFRVRPASRSKVRKTSVPSRRRARPQLTIRYPKTLRQVAANDPPPQEPARSAAAPLTAPAARRRTIPVLRPPGAIREEDFLAGCTRCEDCIQACPHDAIVHAPARLREAAGTPMIDADHQPCLMCADFPCIAACEPGVLTRSAGIMMGTARITEHLCVAHHGTPCTVCNEACPVPDAITFHQDPDGQEKPAVNENACTGCGVCRHVCPAPENAILLMPTFIRPNPPQLPPATYEQ